MVRSICVKILLRTLRVAHIFQTKQFSWRVDTAGEAQKILGGVISLKYRFFDLKNYSWRVDTAGEAQKILGGVISLKYRFFDLKNYLGSFRSHIPCVKSEKNGDFCSKILGFFRRFPNPSLRVKHG